MLSDPYRAILPQPPDDLKQLSSRLSDRIARKIKDDGPVPFSRYMEMALYEPGLGYYSAGLHKLGEGGDFVTAPELGDVFARCLAGQIGQLAEMLGDYAILEIGAGSGALAAGLLTALEDGAAPEKYMILESSADLRQRQRETLQTAHPEWMDRVEWLEEPPTDSWQGVLLANEVVDALPVERFRLASGKVQQVRVTLKEAKLDWCQEPAPATLVSAVEAALGADMAKLADGYESEICPMLSPWLKEVTASMVQGCALFIDYGYPRREYYSEQRSMGTLVCHYQHRGHDDPLWYPGLQDISAFVDFTALAEAGDRAGLECAGYTSQAMFLFGCGLDEVLAGHDQIPDRERLALIAEVRRLTLPGEMGEKFQVMALCRGIDLDLCGFEMLDLRYRL